MNDNNADDQPKSLGDRFRAMIEPALNDERRKAVQLEILDNIFTRFAAQLESQLESSLEEAFKRVAAYERQRPADRNPYIVRQLTETDQNGDAKLPAVLRRQFPICGTFLELAAQDITELPGYIALHEKARDMNVALHLSGLTMDETKTPNGYPMPVLLIIDLGKTYEEGAIQNAQLYPNLPPKKPEVPRFDHKAKGGFEF